MLSMFDFKVAPLSINTIPYRDKFQDRKIYLGMKNIKGLPRDLAYWIIDNRPFESVEDLFYAFLISIINYLY